LKTLATIGVKYHSHQTKVSARGDKLIEQGGRRLFLALFGPAEAA
jgi:hypothetical protein